MSEQLSFIETQFPVSRISKESYKERMANNGQTLTGLGKWWGRKPLILIRAALLGCLMPVGDNPKKDTDIFLKILSMDDDGLVLRKNKKIPTAKQYEVVCENRNLSIKYLDWFANVDGKITLNRSAPKEQIERAVFDCLGYDDKLIYCQRPEQLDNISSDSWTEINQYLGTSAESLTELIHQLSIKKYGHDVIVGDCFCGGGSIPYEAARIGCNVFASDLNPIAGLLSWSDINISGAAPETIIEINAFLKEIYDSVNNKVDSLGIETNELNERGVSYLYCEETLCPECGSMVPLSPSWDIGKGTKTVAYLKCEGTKVTIDVKMGVSQSDIKEAEKGTIVDNELVCPCCGMRTPISSLRHDTVDSNGNTVYGLRKWERSDFTAQPNDVYHERLFAIKYEKADGTRYYRAPNSRDFENEKRIIEIVRENFNEWQEKGFVPCAEIEPGYNTDQIIRERGWKYWHQAFCPRQLLTHALISQEIYNRIDEKPVKVVAALLGLNKLADWDSKLCRWDSAPASEKIANTFFNQALNTIFNYPARGLKSFQSVWFYRINNYPITSSTKISLSDARDVSATCDLWITDPPYADAVNYHELSEHFLAWDKVFLQRLFPEWYTDSKRVLAVKGDEHFSQTMIDIYSHLVNKTSDNGRQIVMFTHSNPSVWAQLAIIMWKSGLKVSAAWNISTETSSASHNGGNYVKGTVLLVLRKQTGDETAFLDEINVDIRSEVKRQIANMQELDDKDEPNFSDPDYVLAAYAASLKVLTSYAEIEDLNLDYELNRAISNPSESKIVRIIENAKKVAYDCVIPMEFDSFLWRDLTNAEKFYIKGIESEKHGNYQIGTYQEFARGFSVTGYSQLMASERANTARLKTPFEMAGRSINDVPDFETSLMRSIFQSIYTGIKEDMNPNKALGFLKNDIQDYWDKREMIKQILSFLIDIKDITDMQPHWKDSAEMADQLYALVNHDSI